MNSQEISEHVEYFLDPKCIRERSQKIYERIKSGETRWILDESQLSKCADFTLGVIKTKYPDFKIPFHSRRGHLRAGGTDRIAKLFESLADKEQRLISEFDLIITSVFLDAGAGDKWKYTETSGKSYGRSEGLAVASYDLVASGALSSENIPFQVNAEGLAALRPETFAKAFQAGCENPLIGVSERCVLMNNLADCLRAHPEYFEHEGKFRPGHLALYLTSKHIGKKISAIEILRSTLLGFDLMWPPRLMVGPMRFGDIWHYKGFGAEENADNLIAFHKLSQWLSYSLMEALMDFGMQITEIDALTGLPEYRNGGLFVDLGVLSFRDKSDYKKAWKVDSDTLIEWRAATVCLLDKIAVLLRERLGVSQAEMPLVKLLEGGTWHAGREAAKVFRNTSEPPIILDSDATVF